VNDFKRYFPWLVVGFAVLYLIYKLFLPGDPAEGMHLEQFATLPVVANGRTKPIDTFARNSLMALSGKSDSKDENGKTQPAVKWLLDVMTSRMAKTDAVAKYKVFRIEDDKVLGLLGLPPRAETSFRYARAEFEAKLPDLIREAQRARRVPPKQQSRLDVKVLEFMRHVQLYEEIARLDEPLVIPPQAPGEQWQSLIGAVQQDRSSGQASAAVGEFAEMLHGYSTGQPDQFNKALAAYAQHADSLLPSEGRDAGLEMVFNHFEPFYQCAVLYVFVFLLACLSWVGWREPLAKAALWLAVVTFVVHTLALGARMLIQGRPPVTNLYSSAVFVGWGAVLLCVAIEWYFRNGVGNVVAAVVGAITMVFAIHLGGSGDTLQMMEAVLDTNFWLATHVTCIALGYTTTIVAGVLGMVFIFLGLFTRLMDRELYSTLSKIIYGVLCFATLLSFTGTVLGGIWADQSWGRFWGWDPKENGALLIVIWNALVLHARWGGMIKQRGLAVLTVVGVMVTGWSWIGTNQLGVGLHAYGFNNTLARALVAGWFVCGAFIGAGLLPLSLWGSYGVWTAPLAPPAPRRPAPAATPSIPDPRRKRGRKKGPGFSPA
jgi:ABC-type transport system involved in cytochrome c biogenesis permease subunit